MVFAGMMNDMIAKNEISEAPAKLQCDDTPTGIITQLNKTGVPAHTHTGFKTIEKLCALWDMDFEKEVQLRKHYL